MLVPLGNERGFTLAELMVATLISTMVLGGAVAITSQVQAGYTRQIEAAAAEQEGRYALDWMSRLIRAAGNNPYNMATSVCPAAGTPFAGVIFNPDGDTLSDDIRLQTDSNPPDRYLGGAAGSCNQKDEDVTVSFDPATRSITFRDNNLGGAASIRTDAVIANLRFVYRDSAHAELDFTVPANAANVVYIETQVTVRGRTIDVATGNPITRLLTQEVRIRGRNF
ncbi:MAG: prepilin-type N-terminal cleavage/methylation domain-containing protein [Vicinamibacterales bacterium]